MKKKTPSIYFVGLKETHIGFWKETLYEKWNFPYGKRKVIKASAIQYIIWSSMYYQLPSDMHWSLKKDIFLNFSRGDVWKDANVRKCCSGHFLELFSCQPPNTNFQENVLVSRCENTAGNLQEIHSKETGNVPVGVNAFDSDNILLP